MEVSEPLVWSAEQPSSSNGNYNGKDSLRKLTKALPKIARSDIQQIAEPASQIEAKKEVLNQRGNALISFRGSANALEHYDEVSRQTN